MIFFKQKSKSLYVAWLITLFLLISLIAIPLLLVLLSAGSKDFVAVASSAVWHKAMLNTLLECFFSTFFSVCFGYIYAFAIVKAKVPFKKFFRLIPLIHLITPPFVGGLAFILLVGRQGFITHHLLGLDVSIYGFWGLLLAQTLCFFPMSYLICLQTISGINQNLEKAAKSMGAGKLKIFCTITFPLSLNGLISSFLFIAVSVLSDFGNPLIVAGRFRVLAVEIYTQLTGWLNVGTSAALGIVLVIPSIILFMLQTRVIKNAGSKLSTIGMKTTYEETSNDSCSLIVNILLSIFVIIMTVAILAQLAAIIAGAFQKLWGVNTSFTLEHIKTIAGYSKELKNSVLFALTSAFFATIIAALTSFFVHRTQLPAKKIMDTFVQLPSAIPGSLLGLAISIFASKLHFKISFVLIIMAMTISFMPFAYKIIAAGFSQISMTLDDGARALGANQLFVLGTILFPIAGNGIFSGFIYAFIRGVGTLSAVIFLVSFKTPLTSVRILNLAEEGFWGKSAALALFLTIITFLILGIGILIVRVLQKILKNRSWK